MESPKIERALISVSDKMGLVDFAQGLVASGVEIYSTGGTRRHLEEASIPVKDISTYTGFPEMMEGRLKTLHPKVHGGILCRHDNDEDMQSLSEHEMLTFPLVVVNLYPFEATVAREGVTRDEAIENIDIGGPTMIRAAAKNQAFTTIATDPAQYAGILEQVAADGCTTEELRRELALQAFAMTARYDRAIIDYFAGAASDGPFPATWNQDLTRRAVLRYGENPHQQAALYADTSQPGASVVTARQLNGKELSYNNLLDLDAALAIAKSLPAASAIVIKHNNPCGAASGETLVEATKRAFAGDPVSAFGSVLGFNRTVDRATAEYLAEPGLFVEAIIAPGFDNDALEMLTTRPKWKSNVRLMQAGDLSDEPARLASRDIAGGLLLQEADVIADAYDDWQVAGETHPTDAQVADLRFAWCLVRSVKSNAIVLAADRALVGVGAGQMSRVDSVEISIRKAGERVKGSVLASDAFFPFPDSIERAHEAGVTAIIQPGGSRKDDEVIAAANQFGLPMILTGRRHFKH